MKRVDRDPRPRIRFLVAICGRCGRCGRWARWARRPRSRESGFLSPYVAVGPFWAHISVHMMALEERMKGPRFDHCGPWPVAPAQVVKIGFLSPFVLICAPENRFLVTICAPEYRFLVATAYVAVVAVCGRCGRWAQPTKSARTCT